VNALIFTMCGATGVFLLYSRFAFDRRTLITSTSTTKASSERQRASDWLAQAGLIDVHWREFAAVCATLFAVAFLVTFAIFGSIIPGAIGGTFASTWPLLSYRQRRARRIALAQESWPRMIEEVRILTGSIGASIPQALFQVGRRAPVDLKDAFDLAHREWLLSTNFERAIGVLKSTLADSTADAACETLLTAHQIGGVDLNRRLADLAEDRLADVQGRKDARAQQAGARFARLFVLIVPIGMAFVGLTIGDGRAAYQTSAGQVAVVIGLLLMTGCWLWAGRMMMIPAEQRVFAE
jgi:tight adherence protein B